ncbi:hypothetical protein B5S29_g4778 [[Candida] boidinii]|nr:hypothetical protein B5S29_g4778 [[Candida] boidinii]
MSLSVTYPKRVSFNNIHPIFIDPFIPQHIPPQYEKPEDYINDPNVVSKNREISDLNLGYGGGKINDISKTLSNSNNFKSTFVKKKRLNSLPPPPEKSILKKSKCNNHNTHHHLNINNNNKLRKNSATSSSSVLFSDSENEDDETKQSELEAYDAYDDDDTALENNRFLSKLAPRKKSLVEMTTEEILALDEQFSKKTVSLDKFSFDSTPSFYTDNTITKKNERSGSNNYTKAKLDNFSKNGKYPTKRTISHGSCCLTVKHSDFPNILSKENTNDSNNNNDDDDNNDSEELTTTNNLSSTSTITNKKKKRNYKTYLKNINTKENLLAKKLNENTRVIMTVISGKNSTWSTIDYFLKDIAKDGDIFIITCSLPISELTTHKLRKKKSNTNGNSSNTTNNNHHDDSFVNTNEEGLYHNDTTYTTSLQEAQKISEVIMNYTLAKLEKLNPTVKLQITVELMNTKDSSENYKESLKIYSPKLILMGTTLKNSILQDAKKNSSDSNNIGGGSAVNTGIAVAVAAAGGDDDVKKIMKFTPAIIQSYPVPVILVQTSTCNCPLAKANDHGNGDASPMAPGSANNTINNSSSGIDTVTPNLTAGPSQSSSSSSANQASNTIKAGSVIFKQPFAPKIEISEHHDNDDISINSSSEEDDDEDLFKDGDLSRRKSRAMTNSTNPNEFEYDEEDEILTETLLSNTSNLNETSSIFTRRLIILSTKLATDVSVDEFLDAGLSDDFAKLSFSNFDLRKTKSMFPTSHSADSSSNKNDSSVLSNGGRNSNPEIQSFGANLYKPITITSSSGSMVIDKAARAKFNEMAASVGLSPNLTSMPNSNAKSGSSIIEQYNRRMSVQTPTGSTSGPSSSSRKKSSMDPFIPVSPSTTDAQNSAPSSSSSSSNYLKVPNTYAPNSASNSTSSLTYEIPSPLMKSKTAASSNSSLVKTKSRSKSSSSATSSSKSGFFGKLFKK